jgi:tetratricopeptide (TPR) repeat protein
MGDFDRAMTCFREAEEIGLALDDRRRLGEIYAGMAYLLGSEGDYAGASQTGVRALTIAASLDDLPLQVWTSIGLVRVYFARGEYGRAIERTRWVARAISGAPIAERFGRATLLPSVACRSWLALCLAATGDFVEALAWATEGVRIADAVGGPHEKVWADYGLARVHLARGNPEQAIPLLERARPLCEGRIPLYWPRVVAALGRALTLKGDLDAARPLLERAVDEVRAVKLLYGHPIILMWKAAAQLRGGQLEDAEASATRSLELARQHGARADEAWALLVLAQIAMQGTPSGREHAHEHCAHALAIGQELHMAPLQARCRLTLGDLHLRDGHAEEARDELTRAVTMLEAMQMSYWQRLADTLLASLPT